MQKAWNSPQLKQLGALQVVNLSVHPETIPCVDIINFGTAGIHQVWFSFIL